MALRSTLTRDILDTRYLSTITTTTRARSLGSAHCFTCHTGRWRHEAFTRAPATLIARNPRPDLETGRWLSYDYKQIELRHELPSVEKQGTSLEIAVWPWSELQDDDGEELGTRDCMNKLWLMIGWFGSVLLNSEPKQGGQRSCPPSPSRRCSSG